MYKLIVHKCIYIQKPKLQRTGTCKKLRNTHIYLHVHTCSAELMHVGSNGITGNMYSRGYNMDTNAITLIDRAL